MIRLNRRTLLLTASAFAIALTRPSAAQATDTQMQAQLLDLYAALETVMKAGRSTPFSQRFDTLAPVVDKVFDLQTVLKVSVGMRWDTMTPDVQDRLLKAFRRFTVATYVANFDKYDGEQFQVLPGARDSGTDRIVGSEIVAPGQKFRLDYVMRDGKGVWRVVDVLLDGSISRVAVQRSDFRKILASGDADALIASLKRKVADLSDGTLSS
jgi:phospholipid transport system substrate-binding protein